MPARATLHLTAVLTGITIYGYSCWRLPKISYATAIDIWLLTCVFMEILSTAEFVTVCAVDSAINSNKNDKENKQE